MAYVKNNWVDQEVERPKTYEMTNNADGSVTLVDSFGLVSELGTPVNADNMNHIEEGIAGCDLRKYNLIETYEKGEWVTGVVEDKKGIYESLTNNNYGNPLTDTEKWQKVELGGGGSTSGGYNLFDLVKKDHIVPFEESEGIAFLGTYVYKTGISGTRYGYPEFVQRCIDEMKAGEDYLIIGDNITLPTFTANTTNGITISDARGNTTNLQKLFNNGLTKTGGVTQIGSWATYWINIDYGKPTYLKSYTICSDNVSPTEYPSAWTIQGSNDGVNFDVLGTYTDKTFTNNYFFKYVEGISYHQTKPYSQYRLVFSAGVESSGNGELGWVAFDAQDAINAKKHPNTHIFYNIAEKAFVDAIYESTGKAYFFGVDEENERIFLPRKDAVSFTPKDNLKVYGDGNGLAFYTGETGCSYLTTNNSYNNSKPLYLSNTTNQLAQLGTTTISQSTAHGGSNKAYGILTKEQSTSRRASTGLITDNFKQDDTFYYYMVVGNTKQQSAITDVVDVTTSENDTTPLFEPRYYDYKPNNVSWLKAGEQVNSSGIYTFAYNELVNELTTPKYGLKVIETSDKVSGTDYSEYWEVNQDEMWFKTPSKISYKALTGGVKGNEKSLGITDGTTNYGITNDTSAGLVRKTGAYNQDVGYSTTTNNASLNNVALGVVTNASTSGIIAEESTAQLYFKVANAVQNLELMDAGAITEALADKIGRQECPAYITQTYLNDTSGYNVYSNGYGEQWGYKVLGAQNTMTGIKLLKKYRDSNYNALASNSGANTTYYNVKIGDTSTNTPDTLFISASSASTGVRWHTWGYLAEGEY